MTTKTKLKYHNYNYLLLDNGIVLNRNNLLKVDNLEIDFKAELKALSLKEEYTPRYKSKGCIFSTLIKMQLVNLPFDWYEVFSKQLGHSLFYGGIENCKVFTKYTSHKECIIKKNNNYNYNTQMCEYWIDSYDGETPYQTYTEAGEFFLKNLPPQYTIDNVGGLYYSIYRK